MRHGESCYCAQLRNLGSIWLKNRCHDFFLVRLICFNYGLSDCSKFSFISSDES